MTPSIRDLPKARVVVIGDYICDVWVTGTVDRISPEAPVPVFLIENSEIRPGGAGNVGANLVALGCFPEVFTNQGNGSARKTRYVCNGQQMLRVDDELVRKISRHVEQDIYSAATFSPLIGSMVISDYGKGMFLGELAGRLIGWALRYKIPTVVDPKGSFKKYAHATVITPNEKELGDEDPEYLIRNYGFEAVLVTRGAKGMSLFTKEGVVNIPSDAREVYDVAGAGDTVVAVLAAALGAGFPILEAAKLANTAAGVVVGKRGTATCSLDELAVLAW